VPQIVTLRDVASLKTLFRRPDKEGCFRVLKGPGLVGADVVVVEMGWVAAVSEGDATFGKGAGGTE